MSSPTRIRRALLSVSDKTGLVEFAQALHGHGVELISTGGTAKALREAGLPVTEVSSITEFPEMMDGRVKTLHPKVHGGLLARRDDKGHMKAALEHGIGMIDLLVVNLYPFEETLNTTEDFDTLVENIDIGGPAMIRAASKNFAHVWVVVDPENYPNVIEALEEGDAEKDAIVRRILAAKAFARTASYDTMIGAWLSGQSPMGWPEYLLDAKLDGELRYGENPHQKAAVYRRIDPGKGCGGLAYRRSLQGKELSYNNYADTQAALEIVWAVEEPCVAIIKHANPCGVAVGKDNVEAFIRALAGDPQSAFGGILATNRPVTKALVEAIGGLFLEVIAAQDCEPEATMLLQSKKNLRVLLVEPELHASPLAAWHIEPISGGYLVQDKDEEPLDVAAWKSVSGKALLPAQQRDALLAFQVVKAVKSNAIVLVKDGATIGIGAGQMSRVDSVRIAIEKAKQHGHETEGAVLASDAFFPFADNVELAAQAGIAVLVQPGGSVRDQEVIDAANKHGIAMLFTGTRHFKH